MQKPDKPFEGFPLYPHGSGYWAKKIRGKTIYFGTWGEPEAALAKYQEEKDFWESGIDPRHGIHSSALASVSPEVGVRLGDGCNLFLDSVEARVGTGSLSQRSYADYKQTLARLLTILNRYTPINSISIQEWIRVHRELSKGRGPVSIGQDITRIKTCFKWLAKNDLIKEPRYGSDFKKPAKVEVRRARANSGRKWFSREEITSLLAGSSPALRAMILLGVNCGFGNGDCSQLLAEWLDLKNGWVDFDRPKTGTERRCKLWPETIAAVRAYQKVRPKLKAKWLFVTKYGNQWSKPDTSECAISREFQKLCRETGNHIPGRGFYGLRRTFETIAGGTKDQVAVDYVMGHLDHSMGGVYRQMIDDSRLEAVAEYMRAWVFAKPEKKAAKKKG
jgi:integrase